METVGRKVGARSHAPLLALLGAGAVSMTDNALTRRTSNDASPGYIGSRIGPGIPPEEVSSTEEER
jgi:hypothetical protein